MLLSRLHNLVKLHSKAVKQNVLCGLMQRYSMTTLCEECTVEIHDSTGVATATLKKPPVNSLNLEFLQSLTSIISELENTKNVRGLIITSGIPKIFSGGLDILEMYQAKAERASKFWEKLQDFWLKLYLSPLVTIAAVNGNSPAGGCVIAMSCDYRVMASGKYRIGLNETHLGLAVPFWFKDIMKNMLGQRETERAIQLGYLYSPEEALKVGLVDELVAEENILDAARKEMNKWLEIPSEARILSKLMMRQSMADNLIKQRQEDVEHFINFVMQEDIQKALGVYMKGLKAKKG